MSMINIPSHIFPRTPGAYLVGGSIRDCLLGNPPTDYDVVVSENAEKYARQIASNLTGRMIKIGKPGQTIMRVVSQGIVVDISSLNGKTIADDLLKRDFSINAMAYDLSSKTLIDNVGGQTDLVKNTIRMLSPQAFVNDPLRLLRAYRLAACLNFAIESKTISAIERHAELIQHCASERIRDELFKMLSAEISYPCVSQMTDNGLLIQIFPELFKRSKGLVGVPDSRHAIGQTLDGYNRLEILLNDLYQVLPRSLEPFFDQLDDSARALLKFSMLWHDIGTPPDHVGNKDSEHHTGRYATESAETAKNICRRLRFSNRHTEYIDLIIQNHARPFVLNSAYRNKSLANKTVVRFFISCGNQAPEVMVHALAQGYGSHAEKSVETQSFLEFMIYMLEDEYTRYMAKAATGPIINGHDLIYEFGLKPSPVFKQVLRFIEEERLSRLKMTRADALDLAKQFIAEHDSGV
jgi:tRNA nucleotidyltransferase/poly(A) polymerase